MKSIRTRRFRALLRKLPPDAGLHFKQVNTQQPFYSVRIGRDYRALGLRETDDVIIWVWIGTHAEYDKILPRL